MSLASEGAWVRGWGARVVPSPVLPPDFEAGLGRVLPGPWLRQLQNATNTVYGVLPGRRDRGVGVGTGKVHGDRRPRTGAEAEGAGGVRGKARLSRPQSPAAGKERAAAQPEAHACKPQGSKESLSSAGGSRLSHCPDPSLCVLKTWVPSLTPLQLAV